MGKDSFSIDDILNEYPKNSAKSKKLESFDLDELLGQPSAEKIISVKAVVKSSADNVKDDAPLQDNHKTEADSETAVRPEPKKVYATAEIRRIQPVKAPESGDASDDGERSFSPKKSLPKPPTKSAEAIYRTTNASAAGQQLSKDTQGKELDVKTVSALKDNESKSSQNQTQEPSEEKVQKTWEPSKLSKGLRRSEAESGHTQMYEALSKQRPAKPPEPVERKKVEDVELNIKQKVKPFTGQLEIDENATEEEKRRALEERRKRKISQFLLDKDSADTENSESTPADTEFRKFEDAPVILAEISEIRATMFIRLIVLAVLGIISAYASAAIDYGFSIIGFGGESQQSSYIFLQVALCVLAIFVSYSSVSSGLKKLLSRNADVDSLTAVVSISAAVSALMFSFRNYTLINGLTHIYINVAIFALFFNAVGKLLIINRVRRNFNYITGDSERHALTFVGSEERAGQITRGALTDIPALVTMRQTEFLDDFKKHSYSSDISDKFCRILVPVAMGVSLLCAIISCIVWDGVAGDMLYVALSIFTMCMSATACFALPFIVNLPLGEVSKKLVESSGALLGYQSVEDFSETNSIMIDASKLFPQGTVSLHAIKVFSDTKIDEAIIEAASLTSQSDSILKHMFYDVIVGKTEMLSHVENYVYEDSMGLCGWINNRRILLGNRELMLNHSVEGIPSKAKEKEYTDKNKSAVYLSVSGNLAALFIVEINASLEVKKWLRRLCAEDVCIVLRCVDSILSVSGISDLFDIPEDMLKIMPFRMHKVFEEETDYVPKLSSGMVCSGRISSMASLIISAKRVKKTALMGMVMQISGALLGAVLCLLFVIMGKFSQINATMLLLYNLIWSVLSFMMITLRRH